MNAESRRPPARALRTFAAGLILATALPVAASRLASPLMSVDLYDRTTGAALDVYERDGQRYVVGTPGHEYAVRIRNCTGDRILAVTSVDGVNVVTGETASPDQSGYVIDAGGSVEIAGWRRSLERTAAFYFTDLGASYAARTGRPLDVGVVGVAVFRERAAALVQQPRREKLAAADGAARERDEPSAGAAPAPASKAQSARADGALESGATASAAPLGTGFGRPETSYAVRVRFERATQRPADTIAIRYDRRENLIAMGVLPAPRYAGRAPDPFPSMRFVPEPR
jgi:hypothetical protein